MNPPANPSIVLYHLHANVWWGAILTAFGALYCYQFSPNINRKVLIFQKRVVWRRKNDHGPHCGNRGFFPDHLAKSGREECCASWQRRALTSRLTPEESKIVRWKHGRSLGVARIFSGAIATASTASS